MYTRSSNNNIECSNEYIKQRQHKERSAQHTRTAKTIYGILILYVKSKLPVNDYAKHVVLLNVMEHAAKKSYINKKCILVHVKHPLFLSDFNESGTFRQIL